MKRTELIKRIRAIARSKGVEVSFTEGSNHTIVRFQGRKVTVIGRHAEIPERTAHTALGHAEEWS